MEAWSLTARSLDAKPVKAWRGTVCGRPCSAVYIQRQNQISRRKAEGLQRNPLQNVWTIPWGGIDSDTELYVNSRCRRRGRAPKNSPPWGLGIYAIFRKYDDSDAVCAPGALPTLSPSVYYD